MAKPYRFLALAPFCLLIACTGSVAPGGGQAGSGGSGSTAGSTGQAGATGASGATGAAGTTGTAGTTAAAGTTGTAGSNGSAGTIGTAGTTGVAGTSGTAGTTDAGTTGTAGATGSAGATGTDIRARGMSAGCNKPPASSDSTSNFVLKTIHLTGTFDPIYLAGGTIYKDNQLPRAGGYDFQFRPYSVRLPKNYDPTKAYTVTLGGGGCGGSAEGFAGGPNGGYQPDNNNTGIQVGLAYLAGCFADGGRDFATAMRHDTPEVPYVRQVIAEVENDYCVDKSMVFESGTSSGGWETYTTGCAATDLIRAIGPVSGGLRLTRPPCTGPQASIMVEALADTSNPIGPIVPVDTNLDSPGSAEARDEILKRNGCVAPDFVFDYSDTTTKLGNAPHTAWDAAYPDCVQYTGCPAAYPVVWCALGGGTSCGHQCDNTGGVSYKAGIWKFWTNLSSL
jgi:poly(3-hydroxybutyrate) depolymerase